ncbi:Cysteine--tRNA ligase [candidate division SR1 bacterium Aalborg_AAW-1]|nr:Cysteine--tRNA ligase [candidate division SR1 bacterium Aalborg_AAW-1]
MKRKLKLYNTLNHSLQEFEPIDSNNVRIYSCGPTVYGAPHLGNMRKYFLDDVLKNTIKHILGYPTTHVVNITDVGHLTDDGDHGEDKMEKGARREGLTARDVAKRYEELFHDNCKKLLLTPFDVTPRATEHIAEQIAMVQDLESKGYTYIIPDDGVYMDTSKVKDYAILVGQKHIDGLNKGARIEDNGKKNITDFALWKFNTTGNKRDMERESPWGIGFPGWHIECSAMSIRYLGNHFDVHTGGIDHIPIHHTNEIAQSQCSTASTPWVNYRVHYQFLNIDGQKISKSVGNVVTLDEVFERGYSAQDIRYFFFQANYRSFQDFTRENLQAASKGRKKLKLVNDDNYPFDEVIAPLLDDLNTPTFLANLQKHGISEKLNTIFHLYKAEKKIEIPDEIQVLAEQRRQAKSNKDRSTADTLRDQLAQLGREMNDGKDGYEIVKK